MKRLHKSLAALALMGGASARLAAAPAPALTAVGAGEAARALDLLKASVGFRTEQGRGQVPVYAAYLGDLLRKGGFAASDITIDKVGETGTLILTWAGSDVSLKPLVVSDHMDVVAADPKDWTRDPFTAVVENGYVYGRGVYDDKFDVSMVVTALIALKKEGFVPKRTIVLALSGDEETDMRTSKLLAEKLKGAEMVLNGDSGGGALSEATGKPTVYGLQGGEKTYADFEIAVTSPGGHSSRPGPASANAIVQLSRDIGRIAAYRFPPQSNALTIAYLKATGAGTPGALGAAMKRFAADPKDAQAAETLSANPEYVGQVRTTCVTTMLSGGHALNALPQRAAVTVNCRIFPGVAIATVENQLKQVVDDPKAVFTVLGDPAASDASPLTPTIVSAVTKAVALNQPGVPIVPNMSAGASDSLYYRAAGVPSYGVSAMFIKPSDDFSHGLNERAPVAAIPGALAQWHSLLTTLAAR